MKKILVLLFTLFLFSGLYAQSLKFDYVSQYREAQFYFDENDYGKSLTFAEDAITNKKAQSEYEKNTLTKSLSSRAFKSSGDNLNSILRVLNNRGEQESINIIKGYLKKKGEDYFENSMNKLLELIQKESEYPEAQYLIGKIFQLEGEYSVSETYYTMALENKDVLDVPDFKFEILYNLAEISKLQKDNNKYETRLLNILVDDNFSNDTTLTNALLYTINTNKANSVERFFTLYRASEYKSIPAYNKLCDYYYENGYFDKALKYSALSVITSFTKIMDVISSRNIDFEYSNLKSFYDELNGYNDIIQWGNSNEVWKSFNILAKLAKENGSDEFSKELLKVLVKASPQEYWQKEAVLQLEEF